MESETDSISSKSFCVNHFFQPYEMSKPVDNLWRKDFSRCAIPYNNESSPNPFEF